MIYLILTADYEIFGNGTGDVRCCVINPANCLLNLCDGYGAKLTLFFEVCEYWAFRQAQAEGKLNHLDYDPAEEMAYQAQDAIRRGHDVQLHMHPQWLNGEIRDGQWSVDFSMWRIATLDYEQILDVFRRGKETLESLLCPVNPSYRCIAFRAGSWGIQPEENVLQAMEEVGLLIDSSVIPGKQFDNGLQVFDFRDAPKKSIYRISRSVTCENSHGKIWEIPVSVRTFSFLERDFRATIRRKIKKSTQFPEGCSGSFPNPKTSEHRDRGFTSRFGPRVMSLDLSSDAGVIYKFLKEALKTEHKGQIHPVVAGGHPKFFGDDSELARFLRKFSKKVQSDNLCSATFLELASKL